ncbi:nucleus export BRL1 [Fusarium globosum]|uniref:Nucleus export BRL1 n=1 Tax=Fusarium globosum TaxID=78864 RepID=A0A8H5XNN0_9HYPO|nr:nucleus export BRL1 [Fusarium globosum]
MAQVNSATDYSETPSTCPNAPPRLADDPGFPRCPDRKAFTQPSESSCEPPASTSIRASPFAPKHKAKFPLPSSDSRCHDRPRSGNVLPLRTCLLSTDIPVYESPLLPTRRRDESLNSITRFHGSGKSNILDAICFVLGITTGQLFERQRDESFNSTTGLNGSGKSNIPDAIYFVLGITRQRFERNPEEQNDTAEEAGAPLQLVRSFVLGMTNMSTFERKIYRKQPDSTRDLAHFRPRSRPHASTITRPPTDDKDLNGAPDIYAFEPKAPALSPALPLVVVCSNAQSHSQPLASQAHRRLGSIVTARKTDIENANEMARIKIMGRITECQTQYSINGCAKIDRPALRVACEEWPEASRMILNIKKREPELCVASCSAINSAVGIIFILDCSLGW